MGMGVIHGLWKKLSNCTGAFHHHHSTAVGTIPIGLKSKSNMRSPLERRGFRGEGHLCPPTYNAGTHAR
jgi:hypothetical protein